MPDDVRKLLRKTAFRAIDVDLLLDPKSPTWVKFDPDLGYIPNAAVMQDGINGSRTTYTYEPAGHRRVINHADRPCRINTYGNSYTLCQQVSDGETWQEYLAAHIGEPIRNFGCGGYSVYQSYRRALRMESTPCAAEYIILNVFHDDHVRNLDAARWIRSAWNAPSPPPDQPQQIHGLPWPHLRFDLDQGGFVERPALCQNGDELRALCDPDRFYEAFKDDAIVRLFTLEIGGQARFDDLQALAEALGVQVNLRHPANRKDDALKLRLAYGFKSTEYVLDKMRAWAGANAKKLLIVLSYGRSKLPEVLTAEQRFDQMFVDYLQRTKMRYSDSLLKHREDYRHFNLSPEDYTARYYIKAAVAAVFGHYSPFGNLFFAFSIKDDVVDWLDPKPPAYDF